MTDLRTATNPHGCDALCRAPGGGACPRCEPDHWVHRTARSVTCDRYPDLLIRGLAEWRRRVRDELEMKQ